MKVLFFGDVFGRPGREALKKELPHLKKEHEPDVVIANIENIAHGSGITRNTLAEMDSMDAIDAYTLGDHTWDTPEADEILESDDRIVRPANFVEKTAGRGYVVIKNGKGSVLVVNLLGYVFGINEEGAAYIKYKADNPFTVLDEILSKYTTDPSDTSDKEYVDAIFVDFHAEFTSEKRSLGFYADGRASAVIGTHTHVPSNDAQILKGGTAYLTDAGMNGPFNSVIGLDKDSIVRQYVTSEKQKTDVSSGEKAEVGAVLVAVGEHGKAESIKQIRKVIKL